MLNDIRGLYITLYEFNDKWKKRISRESEWKDWNREFGDLNDWSIILSSSQLMVCFFLSWCLEITKRVNAVAKPVHREILGKLLLYIKAGDTKIISSVYIHCSRYIVVVFRYSWMDGHRFIVYRILMVLKFMNGYWKVLLIFHTLEQSNQRVY